MKIVKLVILCWMLLPSLVVAKSAGWSGVGKVINLYAINNELVIVKLTGFANPGQCLVNDAGHIVVNPVTHPTWFSMIMSAYMAKKDVDIFVTALLSVWQDLHKDPTIVCIALSSWQYVPSAL